MKIDLVVSYVDGENVEWLSGFAEYSKSLSPVRFRTGKNALRYFLRCIEVNLPFINQIFLIVQNLSEVPDYVNQEKVCVVTHEKFIPTKYLPTFNSNTIETFLSEIPGLSERFIYINDDMFVVNKLCERDFFVDDMATAYFSKLFFENMRPSFFESMIINNQILILEQSREQILKNGYAVSMNHTLRPYFKSLFKECYAKYWDKIEPTLTRFRTPMNYTIYMVDLYQRKMGRECDLMTVRNVCIENNVSEEKLRFFLSQNPDTVCIMDCDKDVDIFENEILQDFFQKKFPFQSKYEK